MNVVGEGEGGVICLLRRCGKNYYREKKPLRAVE